MTCYVLYMLNTTNCTKCEGKGSVHSNFANYDAASGTFSPGEKRCVYCDGIGTFPHVDIEPIRAAIFSTRGAKRLRKSMTSPPSRKDTLAARAYYVWRLARFHGGADVTMPVVAMMLVEGDPFQRELDALADTVAREEFGSDLRGAARWCSAMGMI